MFFRKAQISKTQHLKDRFEKEEIKQSKMEMSKLAADNRRLRSDLQKLLKQAKVYRVPLQ